MWTHLRVVVLVVSVVGCTSQPTALPTQRASSTPSVTATATSATPTASPSSSTRPSAALGRTLGGARIGMTEAELRAAMGEPSARTQQPSSGLPMWMFAQGLSVVFTALDSGQVGEVRGEPPFAGRTVEGFVLGGTPDEFKRAYGTFTLEDERSSPPYTDHVMRARDATGLTVMARFAPDDRANIIAVYATR